MGVPLHLLLSRETIKQNSYIKPSGTKITFSTVQKSQCMSEKIAVYRNETSNKVRVTEWYLETPGDQAGSGGATVEGYPIVRCEERSYWPHPMLSLLVPAS